MLTLRQLSERTGYSVSVLSRALNPHPDGSSNISPKTREKIRALVADLGFRPNHIASCMRRGRNPSVGVFLPDYSGSLISDAMFGISRQAAALHYPLNFYFGDRSAFCRFLSDMTQKGYTGLIAGCNLFSHEMSAILPLMERYLADGGKVLFFNEQLAGVQQAMKGHASCSFLFYDDAAGGGMAARHLHGQGCRRFVQLHLDTTPCFVARRDGFAGYCREHGLACRTISHSGNHRRPPDSFFEEVLDVLDTAADGPVGVFIPSDYCLLAFVTYLSRAGIGIGPRLRLVGYNDNDFASSICTWPFATLKQDFAEEGRQAVLMLEELLQGAKGRNVLLEPCLILHNQDETCPHGQPGSHP